MAGFIRRRCSTCSPAYAEKNPKTVQSLTNAFVRGLKWMASHSAEDIAKVMPAEHALGNMELFTRAIQQQPADVLAATAASPRRAPKPR